MYNIYLQRRHKICSIPTINSGLFLDVNDDIYNKVAVLMQFHTEMKNTLKLINEKKDKSKIKLMNNIEKHQNLLKGGKCIYI